MSPLSTTRSGSVARIRLSAAMPVLARSGDAAVNWMSDSVANDQSPSALPSGENSGSGRRSGVAGVSTSAELSISTLSKMTEPSSCAATLVSITWNEVMRTGNFVLAGNVHTRSFQPALIGEPSGPAEAPSAFR